MKNRTETTPADEGIEAAKQDARRKDRRFDGACFQESLKHIACMGLKDFEAVFGSEMGSHLWHKFAVEKERNVARWVGDLDSGNLRLLFLHLEDHCAEFSV